MANDAVDWFVLHESGGGGDPFTELRWRAWQEKPGHPMEYLQIQDLVEQLRTLPPPERVSQKALLQDLTDEEG